MEDGEWELAIQGGQVGGLGAVTCRQVAKYCYSYNIGFTIIYEGEKIDLLKLGD